MKKILLFISLFMFFLNPNLSLASDKDYNSGLIYGENHLYALTAPKGWVLDNTSGVSQGLHAVFYPSGSSWENSIVVMYANVVSFDSSKDKTLQEVINTDVSTFKSKAPDIKIIDKESIKINDGRNEAIIKHFLKDSHGNYEAVAYIAEEKVVVMLVLSSKTEKEFKKSIPAFNELIKSYNFITDKVILPK